MPRTFCHAIRLLLILVTVFSIGLHCAVVQMVGWVSMTVKYSKSNSLSEALVMTFDGSHPCELCKFVEKELGNTQDDSPRVQGKKSDAKLPPFTWRVNNIRSVCHPCLWIAIVTSDVHIRTVRARPPLPPPREVMFHFC